MTLTEPMPVTIPLSTAMREGSRAEHEAAEGSPFMSELLAGRVDAVGYAAYLLRLRVVYAALEEVSQHSAHLAPVAAVADPALNRLDALDADLQHWAPAGSRAIDSPAAEAYAARIHASVADGRGATYLAHHYTRYLGDLSGGQAIGRVLSRVFGINGTGGAGVAFYDFPLVPKPKPYKDAYRARLDAVPLDEAARTQVVEEVKAAFSLNQALFSELSA